MVQSHDPWGLRALRVSSRDGNFRGRPWDRWLGQSRMERRLQRTMFGMFEYTGLFRVRVSAVATTVALGF